MNTCEKFHPLDRHFYLAEIDSKSYIVATAGIILSASPDLDSPILPLIRPVLLEVEKKQDQPHFTAVKFTSDLIQKHPGVFYLHRPLSEIPPLSNSSFSHVA